MARNEVECRGILFFARNDVFCDLLTVQTHKRIYLFLYTKKCLNKRGLKNPRKDFAELFYTVVIFSNTPRRRCINDKNEL